MNELVDQHARGLVSAKLDVDPPLVPVRFGRHERIDPTDIDAATLALLEEPHIVVKSPLEFGWLSIFKNLPWFWSAG